MYYALFTMAAQVVAAVWAKLLPGLYEHFDADRSLLCVAPRPFLIVNNAADPRTPRAGVEAALTAVAARLGGQAPAACQPSGFCLSAGSPPGGPRLNLALCLDVSVATQPVPPSDWQLGHVVTPAMHDAIDAFLVHTVLRGCDTLPADYGPTAAANLSLTTY